MILTPLPSGLVGGWIVQQLLLRGEDPTAIRILDLRPPTRPDILKHDIRCIRTDVTSLDSVVTAFDECAQWSPSTLKLPLTVYHCVAFIGASDRHPLALEPYVRVNIEGTANVLEASRVAGCDIFVATSSGSISISPPTFLPFLPRLSPAKFLQFLPNAEPVEHHLLSPLEAFGSCYAFSKARAEHLVRTANDPTSAFSTGVIRPAHAIYGPTCGVQNVNSISWDYLRRGGSPTWLTGLLNHFVDARNVALGHLWYEDALIKEADSAQQREKGRDRKGGHEISVVRVSGRAYAITDPNPPVTYGHLYRLFTLLSHPTTPCKFPAVPPIPMLLIAYAVEAYSLLRKRWGGVLGRVLPAPKGDLAALQPAIFNMSTANFIYDDKMARIELGYKGAVETLRGLCDSVLEWNEGVEKRITGAKEEGKEKGQKEDGKNERNEVQLEDVVREDGTRKREDDMVQVPAVKM